VPYITTIAAACAAAKGIAAFRKGKSGVKSLQEYHADIK
jgi:carbamoyl-phosphate synthase large subunit